MKLIFLFKIKIVKLIFTEFIHSDRNLWAIHVTSCELSDGVFINTHMKFV